MPDPGGRPFGEHDPDPLTAPASVLFGSLDQCKGLGPISAEGGQLQLNAFEPVIAAVLFESQVMFVNAANTLRVHCVEGITANEDVCKHYIESSIGTVTALNPVIGYDKATELAAEAMKTGEGIIALIREKHILTDEQIEEILNPAALTGQGR